LPLFQADSFATPTIVTPAGPTTGKKFFEFFTAKIVRVVRLERLLPAIDRRAQDHEAKDGHR
jgi:hypothetical protein